MTKCEIILACLTGVMLGTSIVLFRKNRKLKNALDKKSSN